MQLRRLNFDIRILDIIFGQKVFQVAWAPITTCQRWRWCTNKDGTPELMGVTRRARLSECATNAITTVFLLRFGRGGLIGELPDFFDPQNVTTVRRIA